jgi:hypothetical protein
VTGGEAATGAAAGRHLGGVVGGVDRQIRDGWQAKKRKLAWLSEIDCIIDARCFITVFGEVRPCYCQHGSLVQKKQMRAHLKKS